MKAYCRQRAYFLPTSVDVHANKQVLCSKEIVNFSGWDRLFEGRREAFALPQNPGVPLEPVKDHSDSPVIRSPATTMLSHYVATLQQPKQSGACSSYAGQHRQRCIFRLQNNHSPMAIHLSLLQGAGEAGFAFGCNHSGSPTSKVSIAGAPALLFPKIMFTTLTASVILTFPSLFASPKMPTLNSMSASATSDF